MEGLQTCRASVWRTKRINFEWSLRASSCHAIRLMIWLRYAEVERTFMFWRMFLLPPPRQAAWICINFVRCWNLIQLDQNIQEKQKMLNVSAQRPTRAPKPNYVKNGSDSKWQLLCLVHVFCAAHSVHRKKMFEKTDDQCGTILDYDGVWTVRTSLSRIRLST